MSKNIKKKNRSNYLELLLCVLLINSFTFCKVTNQASKIVVRCYYAGYTGDENEPKYEIIQIIGDTTKLRTKLLGVSFKKSDLDVKFNDKVGRCPLCHIYTFEGDLKYDERYDAYRIKVDTFSLYLKPNCCKK